MAECPPCGPDLASQGRWTRPLARSGLGGIAATDYYVIVGDRDDAEQQDVFRCFDARTGRSLWMLAYDAPGELDYGNSPRATPLIENDRVHLSGAMGDLHCVALATGRIIWKRNLVADFAVSKDALSAWGYCSSPLVVEGRLIVNPGAADASVVALDPATGAEVWRCPEKPAGHGSFVAADIGGVRQVIGYDNASLGGWNLVTGSRVWSPEPQVAGDFNVPTPVLVKGPPPRLLVASEMNGTRLHAFDIDGRIDSKPLGRCNEPAPDMATPVMFGRRMFCAQEKLFELACTSRGLRGADGSAQRTPAMTLAVARTPFSPTLPSSARGCSSAATMNWYAWNSPKSRSNNGDAIADALPARRSPSRRQIGCRHHTRSP
jgi:outer membrane protein assembly factor BamB